MRYAYRMAVHNILPIVIYICTAQI